MFRAHCVYHQERQIISIQPLISFVLLFQVSVPAYASLLVAVPVGKAYMIHVAILVYSTALSLKKKNVASVACYILPQRSLIAKVFMNPILIIKRVKPK
jgi:hypothetical protein